MAASTRDTIPSDSFVAGVLAAALAGALVVYASLYGEAAWRFAQAEPRYAEVARGKMGSVVELDALTQALRASPARADLSRAAFVQMVTAQRVGLNSLRAITRLSAARRDLRLGLRASPSDAYAWTRLAVVEHRLGHTAPAAAALGMALQVAPTERKLTAMQFDLAVTLWAELAPGAKAALERRLAWAEGWPDLKAAVASNSADALRKRLAAERAGG
jgi:tetratricopeptide (TPR) repeat protein